MSKRKRFALQVDIHLLGTVIVEAEETACYSAIANATLAAMQYVCPDGVVGLDGCWKNNHFARDAIMVEPDDSIPQWQIDGASELDIDWQPARGGAR